MKVKEKLVPFLTTSCCLALLNFSVWAQTSIYIAPHGSDSNSGTKEKPLKNLAAAISRISSAPSGPVHLILREGTYYLPKTIRITPAVLQEHAVKIMSAENEKVVISGAAPLSGNWTPDSQGKWKTFIGKSKKVDQLFCEGRSLPMARFPNLDSSARFFKGTSADALQPERIKTWTNPAGGYIHALHQAEWGDLHFRILGKTGIDSLKMEGGWQNNRPSPMHQQHRFVENIWEELDAPGEWYYDPKSGFLYIIPPVGVNLSSTRFSISRLDELFHIEGTAQKHVKNLTITGLTLTGTNRTFMHNREPLLRSDWTINRGAALYMEGTEDIRIERNEFTDLGGHAIFFSRYNRRGQAVSNHIHNIGGNGIAFVGDPGAVRSPLFRYEQTQTLEEMDFTPGPKSVHYPAECKVEDNLIHDIGTIEKQVAGVQISMSMDIWVQSNTIYNVPRAGINIGDGCWGGHIISKNDVFNTVLETGDHGAFNSWGRDRYWLPSIEAVDSLVEKHPLLPYLDIIKPITISNNRFHCAHGWDIDLDDGSSRYRIFNNICLNGGLKLREGFDRVVSNNFIINNTFHPHVWYATSKDVFTRNIVTTAYAPIRVRNWGLRVDSNFFIHPQGLQEARKLHTDAHSTSGDPLFIKPQEGNYGLLQNSPVFALGIQSIDQNQFGVRSAELKRLALQPPVLPVLLLQQETSTGTMTWLGASVKNIETLGEQSASGATDRNGVLLVEVPTGSQAASNKLEAGDIILAINGQAVNNLTDLFTAMQQNSWQGQVELKLLHHQQILQRRIQLK